ncbi:hypothetical protein TrCOL_g13585 [Triparma columacea]|uniref:Uncharacterized protein n=1 Tax=Triparma columacea TaxID=722753 RepID=A0A9W7GI70_9STRA|nr:hypothetical protein TrCOL_g13585 [Triparma columacea]
MESPNDNNGPTTSDADVKNVQRIKESLALSNASNSHSNTAPCSSGTDDLSQKSIPKVKEVSIEEGANKYVLVTGRDENNEEKVFVYSRISANYHADVAGPLTEELSSLNYSNIEVLGGGRILLDSSLKKLVVYGYSYGFGMADHAVTVGAIIQTGEYEGYDIEHNNEGY